MTESIKVCGLCGQPITAGEARVWTYNKRHYYHETCVQREVEREDEQAYADGEDFDGPW